MRTRDEIIDDAVQFEKMGHRHESIAQTVILEVLLDIRDLLSHSRSAAQQALDASVERSALRTVKRVADEVSRGS